MSKMLFDVTVSQLIFYLYDQYIVEKVLDSLITVEQCILNNLFILRFTDAGYINEDILKGLWKIELKYVLYQIEIHV